MTHLGFGCPKHSDRISEHLSDISPNIWCWTNLWNPLNVYWMLTVIEWNCITRVSVGSIRGSLTVTRRSWVQVWIKYRFLYYCRYLRHEILWKMDQDRNKKQQNFIFWLSFFSINIYGFTNSDSTLCQFEKVTSNRFEVSILYRLSVNNTANRWQKNDDNR